MTRPAGKHTASVTAPAKINLALHVTGRRADGYHEMESLVVFAAHGDTLRVAPGRRDEIVVSGPFAAHVPIGGDNLVARARDCLRDEYSAAARAPVRLHLEKNLPVAAGIGGGSSDAAAALRLLAAHWGLSPSPARLHKLGLALGADLPMCLAARPLVARGIGDAIETRDRFPALPMVLVNVGLPLATAAVFAALEKRDNPPLSAPETVPDAAAAARWLATTRNDLQPTALKLVPQIGETLEALTAAGALTARMSGSGATCFGLFAAPGAARRAAQTLRERHPEWFVLATETRPAEEMHAA